MLIGERETIEDEQRRDEANRYFNPDLAPLLQNLIQQQMNSQEQNRELLLQGLANLTEASTDIRTHTSTLQQSFVNVQDAILQQLSTIQTANVQGAPSSTASNNENSNGHTATISVSSTLPTSVSRIVMTQPDTPPRFRDNSMYNPMTFLQDLEKYFKKANIQETQQLETAIESLEGPARNWATIYQRVWNNFNDFRDAFIRTYWSYQEQAKLRQRILTETWTSKHTMSNHFAYFVSMAEQLTEQFQEEELTYHLIRHFPTHLQSLWSITGKRTLTEAADFIRQQENIVTFRNHPATSRRTSIPATNPTTRYHPYRTSHTKNNNTQQVNTVRFVSAGNQLTSSGNGGPSDQ